MGMAHYLISQIKYTKPCMEALGKKLIMAEIR